MERIGKRIGKRPQLFQKQGSWVHETMPNMVEWIEGCTIRSHDGTLTKFKTKGPGVFSIKFQGRKLHAQLVGDKLLWDDGETWIRMPEGIHEVGTEQDLTMSNGAHKGGNQSKRR